MEHLHLCNTWSHATHTPIHSERTFWPKKQALATILLTTSKMYLTTNAKTVFWEVLTVVAAFFDNIQRICDHQRNYGFSIWRTLWDLLSVQKEQGTGIFISVLSNRCCPNLYPEAYLACAKSTHHYAQHMEDLNSEVQHFFEFGYTMIHR